MNSVAAATGGHGGASPVDDMRRQEDQQLVAGVHLGAVLEQVAEKRDLRETGHAALGLALLRREDAADDGGVPVIDQHPCRCLLDLDGRLALDCVSEVGAVVRHVYVHDDFSVRGDVRRDLQLQGGLDELHLGAACTGGQVRDLRALRDGGFLVVHGGDAWLTDDLAPPFGLQGAHAGIQVDEAGNRAQVQVHRAGGGTGRSQVHHQALRGLGLVEEHRLVRSVDAAVGLDATRKEQARAIAGVGAGIDVAAPLDAQTLAEIGIGLDDASLDQHLRCGLVEATHQLPNLGEPVVGLPNHDLVAALVELHAALGGQQGLDLAGHLLGLREVQRDDQQVEVLEVLVSPLGLQTSLLLALDGLQGGYPHDVAVALAAQALRLQDGRESLVPGHVLQPHGDGPLDVVAGDDVQAGDGRDETKDRVDVGVDEVQADPAPGIAGAGTRRLVDHEAGRHPEQRGGIAHAGTLIEGGLRVLRSATIADVDLAGVCALQALVSGPGRADLRGGLGTGPSLGHHVGRNRHIDQDLVVIARMDCVRRVLPQGDRHPGAAAGRVCAYRSHRRVELARVDHATQGIRRVGAGQIDDNEIAAGLRRGEVHRALGADDHAADVCQLVEVQRTQTHRWQIGLGARRIGQAGPAGLAALGIGGLDILTGHREVRIFAGRGTAGTRRHGLIHRVGGCCGRCQTQPDHVAGGHQLRGRRGLQKNAHSRDESLSVVEGLRLDPVHQVARARHGRHPLGKGCVGDVDDHALGIAHCEGAHGRAASVVIEGQDHLRRVAGNHLDGLELGVLRPRRRAPEGQTRQQGQYRQTPNHAIHRMHLETSHEGRLVGPPGPGASAFVILHRHLSPLRGRKVHRDVVDHQVAPNGLVFLGHGDFVGRDLRHLAPVLPDVGPDLHDVADALGVLNQCARSLDAPDDADELVLLDVVFLKRSRGYVATGPLTVGQEVAEGVPLADRIVGIDVLGFDGLVQRGLLLRFGRTRGDRSGGLLGRARAIHQHVASAQEQHETDSHRASSHAAHFRPPRSFSFVLASASACSSSSDKKRKVTASPVTFSLTSPLSSWGSFISMSRT